MKSANRQRLWLLALALPLVAGAAWQWQRDRQGDPGTLLALDPTAIQRIDLELPGAAPEHYAKRGGHWEAVDGTALTVDEGRLADLAATAQATVLSWRSAADFDPARIGLAPPAAVLRLDGQALSFGETSVTGPQRYVRVGDRVALVPMRYTPRPARSRTTKAP